MEKNNIEKILDFISDNKYLIIIVTVAVFSIYTGLLEMLLKMLFLVGAVGLGAYLDKNEAKVKKFLNYIKEKLNSN